MSNFPKTYWNENWMSQYLFGLYICYWCSGLHNSGELLCSLEYIPFFITDFNVIATFLKLRREEKGAVDIPLPPPPKAWKAFIIYTALEIPWLMYHCSKIYIHEPQGLRNGSFTVMLLPGFARNGNENKVQQILCQQQRFSISAVGKKCLDAFVSEEKTSNYW